MEQATADDVKTEVQTILKEMQYYNTLKSHHRVLYGIERRNIIAECCGSAVYNKNGAYASYGRDAPLMADRHYNYKANVARNKIFGVLDVDEQECRELLKEHFKYGSDGPVYYVPLDSGTERMVIAYKDV